MSPPRARFISEIVDGVIIVEDDCDGAESVTNDIEAVVGAMSARYDRPHGPLIYRDTFGNWDGVEIQDGAFVAFIPLGVRGRDEAMIGIALHNANALVAFMIAAGMAPPCFSISGLTAARDAMRRLSIATVVSDAP